MRKHWTLLVLGIIVVLLPFLGFPPSFDRFFLVVIGLAIIVISFFDLRQGYYEIVSGKNHKPSPPPQASPVKSKPLDVAEEKEEIEPVVSPLSDEIRKVKANETKKK